MEDLAKLTEEIWNRFLALPINHPMEANEMAMKIHDILYLGLDLGMFKGYGKG